MGLRKMQAERRAEQPLRRAWREARSMGNGKERTPQTIAVYQLGWSVPQEKVGPVGL